MFPPVVAAIAAAFGDEAGPYALMIGAGFIVGIYAHAAKMPKLLAAAILFVLLSSALAIVVALSYDGPPPRIER